MQVPIGNIMQVNVSVQQRSQKRRSLWNRFESHPSHPCQASQLLKLLLFCMLQLKPGRVETLYVNAIFTRHNVMPALLRSTRATFDRLVCPGHYTREYNMPTEMCICRHRPMNTASVAKDRQGRGRGRGREIEYVGCMGTAQLLPLYCPNNVAERSQAISWTR